MDFYESPADAGTPLSQKTVQVQICESILLNPNDNDPDALLYFNRILTAEPTSGNANKYKITPEGPWMVPERYNFESSPDAGITIIELKIEDWGIVLIKFGKISFTAVISDGPPESGISSQEFASALAAYGGIPDIVKEENGGYFREPGTCS